MCLWDMELHFEEAQHSLMSLSQHGYNLVLTDNFCQTLMSLGIQK